LRKKVDGGMGEVQYRYEAFKGALLDTAPNPNAANVIDITLNFLCISPLAQALK
jgi:hypothetical protein